MSAAFGMNIQTTAFGTLIRQRIKRPIKQARCHTVVLGER
jgi:hypothetical protein